MNASLFFDSIRESLFDGRLSVSQVDGINAILTACKGWCPSWVAYALATAHHETARTMQPISEYGGQSYLKSKPYYPWYGRGYVQLTWRDNYVRADSKLGLAGELIKNPEIAKRPDIAAQIMREGMQSGWFTAYKLPTSLPDPIATFGQFHLARRIINRLDKAGAIAGYAIKYQDALIQADYQ